MAKEKDNFDGSRGSPGLEFLMTYGWAIIIVLAAIGALAYFGVLTPNLIKPDCSCKETCVLSFAGGVNEVTCCVNATVGADNKTCVYQMQRSTLSTVAYEVLGGQK